MSRQVLGHYIYLVGIGGVVGLKYLGPAVEGRAAPSPEVRFLPLLLGVVALADYGVSLWMEKGLLGKGPPGQAAIPVIVPAFGVSLAVYGFVVWILGAGAIWFWSFVGLALIHWLHSALRWSSVSLQGPSS